MPGFDRFEKWILTEDQKHGARTYFRVLSLDKYDRRHIMKKTWHPLTQKAGFINNKTTPWTSANTAVLAPDHIYLLV